jgi:hypothetical protein
MQLSTDTPPLLFFAFQQVPRKFSSIGSGYLGDLPPGGSFLGHPITSELQSLNYRRDGRLGLSIEAKAHSHHIPDFSRFHSIHLRREYAWPMLG